MSNHHSELLDCIVARSAVIGVIGLGYVGLPLAISFAEEGFTTIGFDVDPQKTTMIATGDTYIGAVTSSALQEQTAAGRFSATTDFSRLGEADALVICVPTPLSRHREPDLQYVVDTGRNIAACLRPGQVIVLESTTYPGTTTEVLLPLLEASGLRSGQDFFLGFSPEREDPGNVSYGTKTIPKVVSGCGPAAQEIVTRLYSSVVKTVVPVSTVEVAESVKILENVFRAVNIALMNELKLVFDAMGVNVWEVIDAAGTKPFGFMPFYPGPGLGGHCIPIDPFYLTWKAREFGLSMKFIELAGEINSYMPNHIVARIADALSRRSLKALKGSRVLVVGVAYKKNVSDLRESPGLEIMTLLQGHGAEVSYHDPYIAEIGPTRDHSKLAGIRSASLGGSEPFDLAVVCADHEVIAWEDVLKVAPIIVDTRNVFSRKGIVSDLVIRA